MQVSVHLSNQSRTLAPELTGETSKELLITLKFHSQMLRWLMLTRMSRKHRWEAYSFLFISKTRETFYCMHEILNCWCISILSWDCPLNEVLIGTNLSMPEFSEFSNHIWIYSWWTGMLSGWNIALIMLVWSWSDSFSHSWFKSL